VGEGGEESEERVGERERIKKESGGFEE